MKNWIVNERAYPAIKMYRANGKLPGVRLKPHFVPRLASDAYELATTMLGRAGLYFTEVHVAGETNTVVPCTIEKAKENQIIDRLRF